MFDFLLFPGFVPFTTALALLLGLTGLELVALLLGGSLMGGEAEADIDGPDLDGADLDGAELDLADLADLPDLDLADVSADFGGVEGLDNLDTAALEAAGLDAAPETSVSTGTGPASWLGFGKMPLLIWLAVFLMTFGLGGTGAQLLCTRLMGGVAPLWLVIPCVGVGAVMFTRSFGTVFARMMPQNETEALSERSLGRRRGVITQGTAATGRPAEVRVIDGYGNSHYLRAEPFEKDARLRQGTDVLVMRDRRNNRYVLIPLSE